MSAFFDASTFDPIFQSENEKRSRNANNASDDVTGIHYHKIFYSDINPFAPEFP